jgi:hypothetical protein
VSRWYGDWLRDDRSTGRSSSPGMVKNFLFTSSRPALRSTQTSIKWVPEVNLPGHEAAHSPPASAEAKKMWIYTASPHYAFTE